LVYLGVGYPAPNDPVIKVGMPSRSTGHFIEQQQQKKKQKPKKEVQLEVLKVSGWRTLDTSMAVVLDCRKAGYT